MKIKSMCMLAVVGVAVMQLNAASRTIQMLPEENW